MMDSTAREKRCDADSIQNDVTLSGKRGLILNGNKTGLSRACYVIV